MLDLLGADITLQGRIFRVPTACDRDPKEAEGSLPVSKSWADAKQSQRSVRKCSWKERISRNKGKAWSSLLGADERARKRGTAVEFSLHTGFALC